MRFWICFKYKIIPVARLSEALLSYFRFGNAYIIIMIILHRELSQVKRWNRTNFGQKS